MFFILSKIFAYLLTPLIWIIGLLIAAAATKKEKKKRRLTLSALIVILLFTNSFIINLFVGLWTVPIKKADKLNPPYDVGIVLGGNTITFQKDFERKTFNGNIDRILQAVDLYKKGIIKKILVTGASGDLIYRDQKEGLLMASFLREIGIPDSNILVDTLAENTHENALYAKQIIAKTGSEKLLLITSSLHMRRALACFRHEGLYPAVYSTNPLDTGIRWNIEYFLIPNSANLLIWNGLIHEVLGYWIYRVSGYI